MNNTFRNNVFRYLSVCLLKLNLKVPSRVAGQLKPMYIFSENVTALQPSKLHQRLFGRKQLKYFVGHNEYPTRNHFFLKKDDFITVSRDIFITISEYLLK